jgi:hypothetical protein
MADTIPQETLDLLKKLNVVTLGDQEYIDRVNYELTRAQEDKEFYLGRRKPGDFTKPK